MFERLKKAAEGKLGRTMATEAMVSLSMLKVMSDTELAVFSELPDEMERKIIETGINLRDPLAGIQINKAIRMFQKQGHEAAAAGSIVCLHRHRALHHPEFLAGIVNEMDGLLARGKEIYDAKLREKAMKEGV